MEAGVGESRKRLGLISVGISDRADIPHGFCPALVPLLAGETGVAGVVPRRWERKMLLIDAILLNPPVDAAARAGTGIGAGDAGMGAGVGAGTAALTGGL